MMQAHDRIGWLRYTQATNDNRDEMLNQLNYFIVLATGVFDSIAWLALHRFNFPIPSSKGRMDVALRSSRKAGKAFLRTLSGNPAAANLVAFLADPDRQAKINVFYEPRDSIQHRLVLTGAHFNTGQYLSDCNVVFPDADTVAAISAIDRHERELLPFSVWGLIYPAQEQDRPLLEPYRFTGAALGFVLNFVDGALACLDFGAWLAGHPTRKVAAEEAVRRSSNHPVFSVPFP
jgi:hypothetical protein